MTKQELIYGLKMMVSNTDEIEELNARKRNICGWIDLCEKGRYKQAPAEYHSITSGRVIGFIFYVVITGGIGFLIGLVLKWLWVDLFKTDVLFIISVVALSLAWIFFTYAIYWRTIDIEKSEHEAEVDSVNNYNAKLTKAKNDYSKNCQYRQQIEEQIVAKQRQYSMWKERVGGLHNKFCERITIKSLISILEEGRADTLKEAINIYIGDEREYARDEDEREYRREQNELQRQILAEQQYQSDMAVQRAEESARAAASLDEINQRESWREFEHNIGIRR